jgi:antirestriction protein ArdC
VLLQKLKFYVMKTKTNYTDTYQRITNTVMEQLEKGVVIWQKCWNSFGMPKNIVTGHRYKGWNVFLLNFIAGYRGYKTPYFLTYKQALDKGGVIRKGEKGASVVWWATIEDKKHPLENPEGEEKYKVFRIPKIHTVFNIDQSQGITFPKVAKLFRTHSGKIEACEKVLTGMKNKPQIIHYGDKAYYQHRKDVITIPTPETFHTDEAYYKTLFHELAHSTGHVKRLNRKELVNYEGFGKENYSKEELTAELTAAYLSAVCGIGETTINNSAAYLQGWLNALKNDKRLLLQAAAQAQAACDYMLQYNEHKTVSQLEEKRSVLKSELQMTAVQLAHLRYN